MGDTVSLIYELGIPGEFQATDIFRLIPKPEVGTRLSIASLLVFSILLALSRLQRFKNSGRPYWILLNLVALACTAGAYIAMYGLVDEVFVNLEHVANLAEAGRYSFRPDAMVGGTVEVIYYLLHVPFAGNSELLVLGNFLIGLTIALLHASVASMAFRQSPALQSATMAAFGVYGVAVYDLASGFGNGLVSLLFLAALVLAIDGRPLRGIAVAALIPLLRPDGLLWALLIQTAILAWLWTDGQRSRALVRKGLQILPLTLLSLAGYVAMYRLLYGVTTPIPVQFKSVTVASLPMFDARIFALTLRDWLAQPQRLIAMGLIVTALLVSRRTHRESERHSLELVAGVSLLSFGPIAFYSASSAIISQWGISVFWRYGLPADVSLFLAASVSAGVINQGARRGRQKLKILVPVGAVAMVVIFASSGDRLIRSVQVERWVNRFEEARAGELIDAYFPSHLMIGTTELNTFGFMIDRPVEDYWGYTNSRIAGSTTCNGDRTRFSSDAFLHDEPAIFFPYWMQGMTAGDDFEGSLAEMHHTSRKRGNRLGDMVEVMSRYEIMVLRGDSWTVPLLVLKSDSADISAHLIRQGFSLGESRVFKSEEFVSRYLEEESVIRPC